MIELYIQYIFLLNKIIHTASSIFLSTQKTTTINNVFLKSY